jgi:hypothetical protein
VSAVTSAPGPEDSVRMQLLEQKLP